MSAKISSSKTLNPTTRDEWNFAPEVPIGNNPLFEWPWNFKNILTYHRDYWLTLSEVSIFLFLAVAGWFLHQSQLGDISQLEWGWAAHVYFRNFILLIMFAGGLHWLLNRQKIQGTDYKYVAQFGHRGGGRFSFSNQVHDNMFWSLASGVLFWSFYEILVFWMQASGRAPSLSFAENPTLFIAILLFTGVWIAFHFYWVHRFLHLGFMYKYVHALHHRNVNVGPWSGISMHPVEHALYFSSMAIHLVVPSHPIHVMFHGYMLALSAVFGHTGFHMLVVKNRERLMLGHFHHQLHHRYFECNYGSVDFPLDKFFGTFHDGTAEARRRLRNRLGPR